ncbi:MAG: hypothetical protein LC808_02080, partial [Actinobacteria bacterium]|nr:hypothetical protein [Actinomycetota bacterium]
PHDRSKRFRVIERNQPRTPERMDHEALGDGLHHQGRHVGRLVRASTSLSSTNMVGSVSPIRRSQRHPSAGADISRIRRNQTPSEWA